MPSMPPKPCTKPGCTAFSTKGSRCDRHQVKWDPARGSKGSRYGNDWPKIRMAVLDRDDYQCVSCAKKGYVRAANEVDHITPKSLGGDDSFKNLQSLCKQCHTKKTAKEASEARRAMQ